MARLVQIPAKTGAKITTKIGFARFIQLIGSSNPNKLRSVLNTFQRENILLFHANDSSGYTFIAEQVAIIDKNNPQVAARLILPLTRFENYKVERKNKIKKVLMSINKPFISNDLSEIIEKALI